MKSPNVLLTIGLLFFTASLSACAQAPKTTEAHAEMNRFAQDRAAILAMVGTYKVTFDMHETVSFTPDYTILPPKTSGGTEVVFVAEDTGRTIRLQHVLVGKDKDGKEFHVKHWRQDWSYEPTSLLEYRGFGVWKSTMLKRSESAGSWSQTVWQVDDSPRYGGLGHWRYDGNVARWEAFDSARPLPRRDATRKPSVPFDRYVGMNRHAITPDGWIHEQDNAKISVKNGNAVTIAHETVLNTYRRVTDPNAAIAESYWAATKDYWAAVRAEWDSLLKSDAGIMIGEDAEWGSTTAEALLNAGDDIAGGKTMNAKAIADAKALIEAKAQTFSSNAVRHEPAAPTADKVHTALQQTDH